MVISPHDVHLWYVFNEKINDSDLLARYYPLLNEEERSQQKRFYFEKHRHQYLITRAMVRSVLSLYQHDITAEQWEFTKNSYGKPSISNRGLTIPLRFNLSHTDELIVMAVTVEQEIGVDVECHSRRGNLLDIASSFFSPSEVKHLFELPLEQQKNRFFDLWTLKEAYIKACGMGLSIPLDQFSYSFSQQGKINIAFKPERNDQPELWQFWQIHPSDNHTVAMALKAVKIDQAYSISMRNFIPLAEISQVDYAITHGSIIFT
jgi:4'-phosphopantetheinyl transferase